MVQQMKLLIASIIVASFAITGCGQQSNAEKVAAQTEKVYPLNDVERNLASINGKQYFEKEWLPAGGKRGQLINCRPSDSNFNGLVSCNGFVPKSDGTFAEAKMYCGYKPELVGCSNEDTVK
jgi:hypothetical protein